MPHIAEMLPLATRHYRHWEKHFPDYCNKIDELLEDMEEHPFEGIGKPEPLKYNLRGFWSRQISEEHRLVYEVKGNMIYVHRCKGHYSGSTFCS
ncbi:MAG: Txe/YoeB family addiction module toxin [Holophagaceae bacterium]|nr:Txe/YoeB family addiction module toxin [Holophagaceae bacterium]